MICLVTEVIFVIIVGKNTWVNHFCTFLDEFFE